MLRIVLGWSFMVQDFSVPMWASGIAVVIMGYLAYQGFRLVRKSASGVGGSLEARVRIPNIENQRVGRD